MPDLLIIFAAGLAAGFLNVVAGGGSLITLPVLLLLGLPAPLANGTNRVAILVQNVAAVTAFRRHGVRDTGRPVRWALWTVPGAVAGALVAVHISDAAFRVVLATVLVLSTAGIFFRPPAATGPRTTARRVVAALGFLGIGFYGGFIQAGVGFLLMGVLHGVLGLDLVRVNAWKVAIVLMFSIPALTVFIITGNVAWGTGLALAAGNASGAVLGTRLSVTRGERAIRVVVAVALVLMAIRLLRGM